jgi:hypothetical protein
VQRDLETLVAGGAVLGISALIYSQVLPGQFAGVELARNPMTFPRFLLALFALGGVFLVIRGFFRAPRDRDDMPVVAWQRVLLVLLLATAYFAAFAPLGFIPTTLIFLPTSMLLLGYRRPMVIAFVTIIAVIALWYAFTEAFSIRPPGIGIDNVLRILWENE